MGLIRNLTSNEIITQVILAKEISIRENLPPLTNIVFMGMGDAGRNPIAVNDAVHCLIDRDRLSMPQSKITISTVGPNPEMFSILSKIPATLAWSLHSSDDKIRKLLVPSTKHTTIELRNGFMNGLLLRENIKTRTIMIAITLIDDINDSIEDATKLAEFILPMLEISPKIVIDLIPYNDNELNNFKTPSKEKVNNFQKILISYGLFCAVRMTRGDKESSACGMLATKRVKSNQIKVIN